VPPAPSKEEAFTPEPEKSAAPLPHSPKITIPTKIKSDELKETPCIFRRKSDKSDLKEKQKEEVLPEKLEPFDNDQVILAWAEFKKLRLDGGAGDTEQLVLSRDMVKSGEHNLLISLASQLEVSILERFDQDVVQFFRKKLSNTLIQLENHVAVQNSSKKLYTSRDKFDHMVEQNPALKELKERLGLDFEY
jgi:DNA polymerase-3 subunit gamma/tau